MCPCWSLPNAAAQGCHEALDQLRFDRFEITRGEVLGHLSVEILCHFGDLAEVELRAGFYEEPFVVDASVESK